MAPLRVAVVVAQDHVDRELKEGFHVPLMRSEPMVLVEVAPERTHLILWARN